MRVATGMSKEPSDNEYSDAEIGRRMEIAVRRALSTPPMSTKKLVGKSERANEMRESRLRRSSRSKPKSP